MNFCSRPITRKERTVLAAALKVLALGWLLIVLCGCRTQSRADTRMGAAFPPGQPGMMPLQAYSPANGVLFNGQVRNPFVEWSEGLTLAQAIVQADYQGFSDPATIVVRRNRQLIPIDPRRLLRGEDFLLAPGDEVEMR